MNTRPNTIIVTRHSATAEWLKTVAPAGTPVVASVTAEEVRGKVVYGNLPLELAAEAHTVYAVSFETPLPRGVDVTNIAAHGPYLRAFVVTAAPTPPTV